MVLVLRRGREPAPWFPARPPPNYGRTGARISSGPRAFRSEGRSEADTAALSRFHRGVKLRFVVVGRDRRDPLVLASDEYFGRIARYLPAEVVEVKEEPLKKSTPVARAMAVEAERIAKALGPDDHLIVLDARGTQFGSEDLAQKLDALTHAGVQTVSLVIGGPSGLDPALIARARARWSLSKLTLPHRLARLVLMEQIYRALTILRGEPYHK